MLEIKTVLGNENNLRHFEKAAARGKLSHAYLVCGPDGSGKKTFTEFVTAALLCDDARNGKLAVCGKCPSCVKILTNNHPDLIFVTHKKDTVITVGEIREQVVQDIVVKPYYGPYKIYVIEDADLMNVNAQNALLKTIEEPPEYGMVFLLTSNADGLLETVRSRCLRVDMDQLTDTEVVQSLTKQHQVEKRTAQEAAAFARGNLGKATELAEGTGIAEEKAYAVNLMKELQDMNAFQINTQAQLADKLKTPEVLSMIRTWFRDVLYVKSTDSKENLYFREEHIKIKNQAAHIAYEDITQIFNAIDETEAQLNANVKTEAAMEVLLINIRQVLR